jgi:(+)-neomenthol dehydrogenase
MVGAALHGELEEARECLKINYFGTKFVTEALLPLLSFSNGRLINVSST